MKRGCVLDDHVHHSCSQCRTFSTIRILLYTISSRPHPNVEHQHNLGLAWVALVVFHDDLGVKPQHHEMHEETKKHPHRRHLWTKDDALDHISFYLCVQRVWYHNLATYMQVHFHLA